MYTYLVHRFAKHVRKSKKGHFRDFRDSSAIGAWSQPPENSGQLLFSFWMHDCMTLSFGTPKMATHSRVYPIFVVGTPNCDSWFFVVFRGFSWFFVVPKNGLVLSFNTFSNLFSAFRLQIPPAKVLCFHARKAAHNQNILRQVCLHSCEALIHINITKHGHRRLPQNLTTTTRLSNFFDFISFALFMLSISRSQCLLANDRDMTHTTQHCISIYFKIFQRIVQHAEWV